MSTEKKAPVGSSTKDLARTLGKKELMGIAIGQIIGAGIMSMMGVAIAMTGRSANLAFMLSAVFTMCTFFPSIFITSCIRMRGGMYTQMAIFAGDKWAGYYSVVYFITNMSLAMYALSFAEYALALLPTGGSQKVIALIVGTLFFVLNYFGVDLMAKIQNLLVIVLLISLTMFAVFGLPSVDFGTYFSNADGLFLSDGVTGFLTATAYLGFAAGGATVILGVSAECKNPTKDIPFVIVTSTVGVALLYGLVATTASGVLPVAEVANQPLTLVAAEILPKPLYIFFIVGGAMFALATTLNSQIMSATKPIMQACEDGWFPKSLAELSRYKTPWKIMLILPPRISRISFSLSFCRSLPSKITSPLVTLPEVKFKSRIIEREVTLFPHPDSPTRPKISPLPISKLISLIAVTLVFLFWKNSVRSLLTVSSFSCTIVYSFPCFARYLIFGSRVSLKPSPNRLNASTVTKIARPGKYTMCEAIPI